MTKPYKRKVRCTLPEVVKNYGSLRASRDFMLGLQYLNGSDDLFSSAPITSQSLCLFKARGFGPGYERSWSLSNRPYSRYEFDRWSGY